MKRLYISLFVVGILLASGIVAVALARARTTKPAVQLSSEEEQLFTVTNHFRGLSYQPLFKLDPALCKVARETADALAAERKLYSPPKQQTDDRLAAAGYAAEAWDLNIAASTAKEPIKESFANLMKNKESRQHMLYPAFEDLGVAIVRDADGKSYIVQLFGKRSP